MHFQAFEVAELVLNSSGVTPIALKLTSKFMFYSATGGTTFEEPSIAIELMIMFYSNAGGTTTKVHNYPFLKLFFD